MTHLEEPKIEEEQTFSGWTPIISMLKTLIRLQMESKIEEERLMKSKIEEGKIEEEQ